MTKKEKKTMQVKLASFLGAISAIVESEVVLLYIDDKEETLKVHTTINSEEETEAVILCAYNLIKEHHSKP